MEGVVLTFDENSSTPLSLSRAEAPTDPPSTENPHRRRSDTLRQCVNCRKNDYSREESKGEKLCRDCLRKLPRAFCAHCGIDFHKLKRDEKKPQAICYRCKDNLKIYGVPRKCVYCENMSAFKGEKCFSCIKNEKTYGVPAECEHCHKQSAFQKPPEKMQQVGGLRLCMLCTRKYKRDHRDSRKPQMSKRSLDEETAIATESKRTKQEWQTILEELQQRNQQLEVVHQEGMRSQLALRHELTELRQKVDDLQRQVTGKDSEIGRLKADVLVAENAARKRVEDVTRDSQNQIKMLQTTLQQTKEDLRKATQKLNSYEETIRQNGINPATGKPQVVKPEREGLML